MSCWSLIYDALCSSSLLIMWCMF